MSNIIGDTIIGNDEHYGYLELGSTDQIMISEILSREALILRYANGAVPFYRVERFIQVFKMTPEEFSMIYACH